jgi:hypothetical protein
MTKIAQELAVLPGLSVGQLQARFAEVFGETTTARNKGWLVKRIAWRLQANAEGGITERIRQRVEELADDADLRILAPRVRAESALREASSEIPTQTQRDQRLPMVGAVLLRPYKGRTLQVRILADGFEFDGRIYGSLSAVAKAATGSHCNGYQFFKIGGHQ